MRIARLISDQNGGVLVEATVMMLFTLIFLFGAIDFLFAFYQWNVANKAAQFGARIAAVSDPVASDLPTFINLHRLCSPANHCQPTVTFIHGSARQPDAQEQALVTTPML